MSSALELAKESYLRKRARLNHGPVTVIELKGPQQPPLAIDIPQAQAASEALVLGTAITELEVEVRILLQIILLL